MVNFSRTLCMVNDRMDKNHLARDLIYAFFIQNNRWKATFLTLPLRANKPLN